MALLIKAISKKTDNFLSKMVRRDIFSEMEKYGQMGVALLSQATPVDTGETAISWHYRVVRGKRQVRIDWYNTHVDSSGTPIAVLIQYGHATGTGGYVQGRDYINPALRPLFDQIANDIWKKVTAS